jgi:hypothetical protein
MIFMESIVSHALFVSGDTDGALDGETFLGPGYAAFLTTRFNP